MSYSALFYCVFEEINEVLENWWYIIEGEGGLFGDEEKSINDRSV